MFCTNNGHSVMKTGFCSDLLQRKETNPENPILTVQTKIVDKNYKYYFLILLQQPKSAPKERREPISAALERGLNASQKANIQPAVIESQI